MNHQKQHGSHEGDDKIDVAFFLLRRNGRFIVGLVLLLGIGFWVYRTMNAPVKPVAAGTWSKTFEAYRPKTNIDSEPVRIGVPEAESIVKANPDRIVKINLFLEKATTEEKIEEALALRETWMSNELPLAYMLVWRRAKIARNVMELDVDQTTIIFAYNEYIESVLTLDALNSQGQLGVPGIREAMIEMGVMFADFPDPIIQSKSSLSHALTPIHDYFETKDLSHLDRFAEQFELHGPKIIQDPSLAFRLVKLFSDTYAKSNYSSAFKRAGLRVVKKMQESDNEAIQTSALLLKEQIYFAKVELPSLAERILGGNLSARDDVQEFFEGLAVNPDSRIEIYKIAVDVATKFKEVGTKEDADALTNWLEKINSKNTATAVREEVRLEIETLRK